MNKSLVLQNKFYLFFSFLFAFFLFIYLLYFLINGQRGLIKYFQLKNQNFNFSEKVINLSEENSYYIDRIARLKPNTLDLDFVEEKLRENTGFTKKNEVIVLFDN